MSFLTLNITTIFSMGIDNTTSKLVESRIYSLEATPHVQEQIALSGQACHLLGRRRSFLHLHNFCSTVA
jgi:hypothetical protein